VVKRAVTFVSAISGSMAKFDLKVEYNGTQKCEAMAESQVANLELFFKRG
jgi:hypothetical protein